VWRHRLGLKETELDDVKWAKNRVVRGGDIAQ
jgi:hypothetical protein